MNADGPSRSSGQPRDPAVGALIVAAIRYLRIRSRQVALEFAHARGVPTPDDLPPFPSPLADLEETRAAAETAWQDLDALLALPADPSRPEPGPVASRAFSEQAPPSEHPRYGEHAMADADQLAVQIHLDRASAHPDLERIDRLEGLRQFYLSIGQPDYWERWLADRRQASD